MTTSSLPPLSSTSAADAAAIARRVSIPIILFGVPFGMFFTLFALFFIVGFWHQETAKADARRLLDARGRDTTGIVTQYNYTPGDGESSPSTDVTCNFTVPDGRVYVTTLKTQQFSVAQGQQVAIRYVPDDPMISEMRGREVHGEPWFVLVGVLFLGVGLTIVSTLLRKAPEELRPLVLILIAAPAVLVMGLYLAFGKYFTGGQFTLQDADNTASMGTYIRRTTPRGAVSVGSDGLTINGVKKVDHLQNHTHVRLLPNGEYTLTVPETASRH